MSKTIDMKLDLTVFYHELCTTIIPHIEKKYFDNRSLQNLGISIKGVEPSCNFIRIIFPSSESNELTLILLHLEKFRNLRFRLSVFKNTILIFEDEGSKEVKERLTKLLHSFLSYLADRVKDFQVTFTLMTPLTVAITTDPLLLRLEANTPDGARRLYKKTDVSWNPRLERGRIVHIDVPKEVMGPYSEGELLLCLPKEVKEIADTEAYSSKVVSFETTYGKPSILDNRLTKKEVLVLQLMCKQLSNTEIASEMRLSKRTIEGYREEMIKKLSAKNSIGLVLYAIKNNLFSIEDEVDFELGKVKNGS